MANIKLVEHQTWKLQNDREMGSPTPAASVASIKYFVYQINRIVRICCLLSYKAHLTEGNSIYRINYDLLAIVSIKMQGWSTWFMSHDDITDHMGYFPIDRCEFSTIFSKHTHIVSHTLYTCLHAGQRTLTPTTNFSFFPQSIFLSFIQPSSPFSL